MVATNIGKDHDARRAPAFRDQKKPGPRQADVQVRPAGPESMAEEPQDWDSIDQAADESFPASDPPSSSQAEAAPSRASLQPATGAVARHNARKAADDGNP